MDVESGFPRWCEPIKDVRLDGTELELWDLASDYSFDSGEAGRRGDGDGM